MRRRLAYARGGRPNCAFQQARVEAALEAFEICGQAALAVGSLGEVLCANLLVEALLGPDLAIAGGRLVSRSKSAAAALNKAFSQMHNGETDPPPRVSPVLLPRAERRPIVACPLRLATLGDDRTLPCVIIVILIDPEARMRPSTARLRTCFGLTAAEARMAIHLMSGKPLGAVARDLRVSKQTVRTQLKALFEKTDVHRQAELLTLLATIAIPVEI